MIRTLNRLFVDHPDAVGESYFAHMTTAFRFGFRLARLSALAFLHGVVPGVHKATVSDGVKGMADDLGYRAQIARESPIRNDDAWDPGL